MFLGKKVLLSPISGQYEQAANAVCAEREGAMVFYQLNALAVDIFKRFFISENSVKRAWPDYTEDLVEDILARAKNGEDLDDISTLQLH